MQDQPFDLTPYYNPQNSAPPLIVNAAPVTTTHTRQESPPMLHESIIDSTHKYDLTRVIIPFSAGDRTSHNSGVGNSRTRSSPPHHYAVYSSRVQSNHHNCSLALGELDHCTFVII
jgi:hypothetical protein